MNDCPTASGSSPLTRGKPCVGLGAFHRRGLIPAHAGKTGVCILAALVIAAHPRSRGENQSFFDLAVNGNGSSPLTRGKHDPPLSHRLDPGLIPAHAGKTWRRRAWRRPAPAHPRSRGENFCPHFTHLSSEGSSPLTRGKHTCIDYLLHRLRLIPAHAGKTSRPRQRRGLQRAHPRSRGENVGRWVGECETLGSSPLTRGKLTIACVVSRILGLIPAHAGKTIFVFVHHCNPRAHPRSRGENATSASRRAAFRGSSPLTRGKHARHAGERHARGLIPAHAGKTPRSGTRACGSRAHPRSRGENATVWSASSGYMGSSPLTRGKPLDARPHAVNEGLIPAHAGKTREN